MKCFCCLLLLPALLHMRVAAADDIEAYLYGADTQGVFVQVVMDLGDIDADTTVCTFALTCRPPFMTEAAYQHLGQIYDAGEAVTAPGIFKAVLSAVLENTLLDNVHLSLLISNHPDNPAGVPDSALGGGSILQGYRKLQTHRNDLIATLKALPVAAAGESHELQPRETYFEWLRYLSGGEVALGQNTSGNFGSPDPLPDYDGSIIQSGTYLAPVKGPSECPGLYSILFTQGVFSRDGDMDAEIAAHLPDAGPLSSFSEFLAYLHRSSTDLIPDTDTVVPLRKTWVVTSRKRQGDAADYAAAGGGEPLLFVDNPVELQTRLTASLISRVRVTGHSLETAFSNDVFSPGQTLDTLFVAQFLPQAGTNWPGNLKKLKLERSGDDEGEEGASTFDMVVDALGMPAYDVTGDNKGQLRFDALTFWTDVSTLPRDNGGALPHESDGPVVARGGAGQKIDGFASYSTAQGDPVQYYVGDTNTDTPQDGYGPRQLFYAPAAGSKMLPFDADTATVDAINPLIDPEQVLTDEQRLNLIRWARGQDVDGGNTAARSWLIGEVLHSRPLALNYGATPGYSRENPNIRVLFGSGDGVFHILQNTDTGGHETGREVFGFFPQETLAAVRWRYDNQGAVLPRYYGVDGAPVVLRVDQNGDGTLDSAAGDEAYVYFGLRRGGSSYFALDISDPEDVPSLAWRISRTDNGSFDELGLTFSTPVVGKVNYSGRSVDVLIFAGGYDGGWNDDYSARRGKDLSADDDRVGNAIYIVNARTGELIWKAVKGETGISNNTRYLHAGMVDSIPSRVSVLSTPEGIVHRLYVGDSGGALWRVDLPPNKDGDADHRQDHWFITKLADLGADAQESGGSDSDDRRFFHAPDIVQSYDSSGRFDGVVIQSGNRASPNETLVENALFYIKDREIITGSAVVAAENAVDIPAGRYQIADLLDQTACVKGTEKVVVGEEIIDCAANVAVGGWQVRYSQPGEKGLSTPLTDGGRVFASTYIPGDVMSCSRRQGWGRMYVLRLQDATAVANQVRHYKLGEGIPAAAKAVADSIFLPGGGIDIYDLDDDGARDVTQFLPSLAGKVYHTYWRESGIDPL